MATKTIKLTLKQQRFARDYARTGNGTEAAMRNYNIKNRRAAAVAASENLTKPNILEYIESIAENIPNNLLVEKHLALLNKMDGEEIDPQAVAIGLSLAYKLKGAYASEKDPPRRNRIGPNDFRQMSNEELDREIQRLESEIKKAESDQSPQ